VFRITTTLMDEGYLERANGTMSFRLTRKFLAYGLTAVSEEDIIENSMDVMRRLRDITDTTAFIGTIYGTKGVMLEQAPGGHPFKLSVDLGTRFLLHSGAPGKAMLAFLPEEEREKIMDQMEFQRFNERTITDRDEFRRELEGIRQRGYSVDRAEEFEGIHCVGSPIMDHTGSVVASLWISGAEVVLPVDKFDEYGPIVREHAMEISRRLGYEITEKKQ
jgi:DNA-binding IclR family transcriptional regulator